MKFILPPIGQREKCVTDGCENEKQFMGTYRKDGSAQFRRFCQFCHHKRQAEKKGLTITQWTNSFHPYRKYRKNYCENIDGRLGFACTTTIKDPCMLDTDHIDGNPTNNNENNLQTLCKCCHSYKTKINGDRHSKGRKTLKLEYEASVLANKSVS